MMKKKNTRSKCRPTTVIDAMLWEQFVQTAAKRLGYKKGVIQTALQSALRKWISIAENGKSNKSPRKAKKSPAMTGAVASKRKGALGLRLGGQTPRSSVSGSSCHPKGSHHLKGEVKADE